MDCPRIYKVLQYVVGSDVDVNDVKQVHLFRNLWWTPLTSPPT
jgi:hypothetical protein